MRHDGPRVLLIDDFAEGLDALRELLESCGYRVRCAARALDGLAIFAAWAPDVVIVDLLLPDLDGPDVIGRIRATSRDVFVIASSGYTRFRTEALEAGADCFVLKPDLDGLLLAVGRGKAATAPRRKRDGDA